MKQKAFMLFLGSLSVFIISCNNSNSNRSSSGIVNYYPENHDNESENDGYLDGTYCAEVEYYNPSTGTRNTYDLDVEVENGELIEIHWPNGGWLDETHFNSEDISSGECEFTSDRGYRFTVTLGDFGGCGYTDGYKIRRDVNNDVEATTCPKCGEEKDEYDNYCFSCKREKEDEEENTCSRCGSYEYGINGGLCSSCKDINEE